MLTMRIVTPKDQGGHVSVLVREVIDGLALAPDATAIDATLGSGGHFFEILSHLGSAGTLLGIDVDPTAVQLVKETWETREVRETREAIEEKGEKKGKGYPRVFFATGNFREVIALANGHAVHDVQAITADLGWRMEQFSDNHHVGGGKGFSFTAHEPLQMTFGDPTAYPFTAEDIVNHWREEDIAQILTSYGEERFARKIATAIGARRIIAPITTADELAGIISEAVPLAYRRGRTHPATKTFQALRIAVNDELDAVKDFIVGASTLLAVGGRLAIISFHSVEDRIVKQTLRLLEAEGIVRRITKKPIVPSAEEVQQNPRARSAKLRLIEKI